MLTTAPFDGDWHPSFSSDSKLMYACTLLIYLCFYEMFNFCFFFFFTFYTVHLLHSLPRSDQNEVAALDSVWHDLLPHVDPQLLFYAAAA